MAAASSNVVSAVCFTNRSNEPIFFKTFSGGSEDYLRLQLAAFAALDAVEEKLALRKAGRLSDSKQEAFLGLLLPIEEHKIFGYITNTQVKIMLVLRDVLLREDRLRDLFKLLHKAYADAASNPFAADGRIESPAFEEVVTRAVEAANNSVVYSGPLPL